MRRKDAFWHKLGHKLSTRTIITATCIRQAANAFHASLFNPTTLPRNVCYTQCPVEVLLCNSGQSRQPWEKPSWPGLNGDVSPSLYIPPPSQEVIWRNTPPPKTPPCPHPQCALTQSCPVLCDPSGLEPARLLCAWGFSRHKYWSGLPCPLPGESSQPRD